MDTTGGTRHDFDASNEAAAAEARKRFQDLTDAGFTQPNAPVLRPRN
jgi:hypothetical protein